VRPPLLKECPVYLEGSRPSIAWSRLRRAFTMCDRERPLGLCARRAELVGFGGPRKRSGQSGSCEPTKEEYQAKARTGQSWSDC